LGKKYLISFMRIRIRDFFNHGSGIRDGKNLISEPGSRISTPRFAISQYPNFGVNHVGTTSVNSPGIVMGHRSTFHTAINFLKSFFK
jgi:hypothetical protein